MKTAADVVMSQYRGWIGILYLCSVMAAALMNTPWILEDSLTDSFFLPFAAEVLMHLRAATWWPHWFILP